MTDQNNNNTTNNTIRIHYAETWYDYADQIASETAALPLAPQAAECGFSVEDEKGAAGVVLVPSLEDGNTEDLYLNAMAAGHALTLKPAEGKEIVSVVSSVSGALEKPGETVRFTPMVLKAAEPLDEIITVTMKGGEEYRVHTLNECMPEIKITGTGVDPANAGVYDFALDKFLLRVNTDGELVYYRNMSCVGKMLVENFCRQETKDGVYYTFFTELHPEYRNFMNGFCSGMYVVMDEDMKDIGSLFSEANDDPHHTHGKGYLEQHEMIVLGKDHFLTLSYTGEFVSNLPEEVKGTGNGHQAYVWAGVFQEVRDGRVLHEISTADYPLLYASSVETNDYENSNNKGLNVTMNGRTFFSPAAGWMDYVHVNSFDYTLDENGNVDKLLVSMRNQCAVYQFDMASGAVDWILGGKASTLTGYEAFTRARTDEKGNVFQALTYGQHFAKYTNRNADGMITGDPEISLFDNQTGTVPFTTTAEIPTLTRTFIAKINPSRRMAEIVNVINGTDINRKTGKYHIASHCGSVQYKNEHSVVIGWGYHSIIDNIDPAAPAGTMQDTGFPDLRIGSCPVFTEYDKANDKVTFELCAFRNPHFLVEEGFFSYRTYKTASHR